MAINRTRMTARLKVWRALIDDLTDQVAQAGPHASLAMRQRIDDLKARCAIAQARLDRDAAAGGK